MNSDSTHRRAWLSDTGAVGEMLAERDWSNHPLGIPETWPAGLRTGVQIALACPQPTVLWWGAALHQFYNDACAALLGDRHPAGLAASAPHAWRALWETLGPPVRSALAGQHTAATAALHPQRSLRFTCHPLAASDGRIDGVLAVCDEARADVVEDAQAREAQIELGQSEERYALAARATREAIWDCDLITGEVRWNRAIADLLGWDAAVRGTSAQWWRDRIHPDERDRVVESVLAATGPGRRRRWHAEYRFQRADGQYADIVDRGFITRDGDGKALRMVGAMLDVTRTKRAETAMREAVAALQDADRRKDEFLATLAHELRNPLAPLRNALYLLQLQEPRAEAKPIHDIMDRQVRQLVRLVDDLLDVSRVTRGKINLQRRVVTLASVVEAAVEASRPLLEAARHTFAVTLPDPAVYIDADPTRLAQVLTNLLNNAAKFTDAGGRVWLAAERIEGGGDALAITVGDTGIGIPPQLLTEVFEMFRQLEHPQEPARGGLGIGLTLVKRLVQMHGGSVEAHSEGIGRGSRFVVRLPLHGGSGSGDDVPAARGGFEPGARGGVRRILVVDDNIDSAHSLALLLRSLGHDVRVAHDGESGLSLALAYRPSLVFLDIGLPRLNGHQVAQRLRARFAPQQMRLVAMTGYGRAKDRVRSSANGFDQHLVKPVEWSAIEASLT